MPVEYPNNALRTLGKEVIDLIATALLRLRASGPVPKNSPLTLSNNPTQPKDPIRPAPSKRVLELIRERCKAKKRIGRKSPE